MAAGAVAELLTIMGGGVVTLVILGKAIIISVQRVPVLLYADDLALVATSARGLNLSWTYCMHTQTHGA